jgi:hypothetical protein
MLTSELQQTSHLEFLLHSQLGESGRGQSSLPILLNTAFPYSWLTLIPFLRPVLILPVEHPLFNIIQGLL